MINNIHCKKCNGKGIGLINNSDQLCTHCIRQMNLYFDPLQCKYCKDGFYDISPEADGGILKKVIKLGEPGQRIEEGCPTFVQYIGRLEDGTIFDTTRDLLDGKHIGGTDDLFEFLLGRGKVMKGWNIGIATMYKGEIARFIIKSKYAYGAKGFPPKVEPFATLDFEIELVRFGEALPPFPTQGELAETRKIREEELKKQREENPPPTIDERLKSALSEKEKGNSALKENDYKAAKNYYDTAFVHVFFDKDEWNEFIPYDDKIKVNKIKRILHLNRALCKINLGLYDDALWDCDSAIEIGENEENVKAYYRRAIIFVEKIKNEIKKEEKNEFWMIEKVENFILEAENSLNNTLPYESFQKDPKIYSLKLDLQNQKKLLLQYKKKYKEEEKKLYKDKILKKMEEKNKIKQKIEQEMNDKDAFADMPMLE